MRKDKIEAHVLKAIEAIRHIGWITRARNEALRLFTEITWIMKDQNVLGSTDVNKIIAICTKIRRTIHTKNSRLVKADRIKLYYLLKAVEVPCLDDVQLSLEIRGLQDGVR